MGIAILKGISFGLLLSVFIGPVFMYLIEVSIKKGVKEALFVDLGIFFSDFLCIIISYLFLNQLQDLQKQEFLIGIITGCIFVVFGIGYLMKSGKSIKPAKEVVDEVKQVHGRHLAVNVLKGFFLNMMNPAVLLYWLTVMAVGVDSFGTEDSRLVIFFVALLVTFFSIDILKIFGASYLRRFLKDSIIERINIFTGITFILGGIFFLVKGFL